MLQNNDFFSVNNTSRKACKRFDPNVEIIMSIWWIIKSGSSCTWYGKYAKLSAKYNNCAKGVFWKIFIN